MTAFQNASGTQSAIVIINQGLFRSNQRIRVGAEMGSVVIPWVTSANLNLAQQPSVAVIDGTIHYSVPAESIVTLQSDYALTPSFFTAGGDFLRTRNNLSEFNRCDHLLHDRRNNTLNQWNNRVYSRNAVFRADYGLRKHDD